MSQGGDATITGDGTAAGATAGDSIANKAAEAEEAAARRAAEATAPTVDGPADGEGEQLTGNTPATTWNQLVFEIPSMGTTPRAFALIVHAAEIIK